MISARLYPISDAVSFRACPDPKFKTMKFSVNLFVPLAEETASVYGILPGIVTRATRTYPDYTALSQRLAQLYGATLGAGVRKMGQVQCLSLSVGSISSRYAFGGEELFAELSNLLFEAVFTPLLDENGLFPEEHFLQEQRQLLEYKESEFNDKIHYAHRRCEELLFAGQPAAVDRYGSVEQIRALRREDLTAAWTRLMRSARFSLISLGDCAPDAEALRARFSDLGSPVALSPVPVEGPVEVRRLEERQPLSQSKLCLGFRVDAEPEDRLLFQLMNATLGGVPSSKLFRNVREKMGLCYYCSSSFSPVSRSLFIESGVEQENLQRAEQEILVQLRALQGGALSQEELLSAKLALRNSLLSVGDSLGAIETWNLTRDFYGDELSPEQAVERLMGYTAEQVIEAAGRLSLGAVYTLRGES